MDLEKLTDEELSIKYKQVDATLQNKILKEIHRRCEHEEMLFSLSKGLKVSRNDISYESLRDALMEAYLKLIQELNNSQKKPIEKLKGWLLRVGKNNFLSNLPKIKSVDLHDSKEIFEELDLSENVDSLYRFYFLCASTVFLKEEDFDVFVDYYFEHKKQISYEQLAQAHQSDKRSIQTCLEISRRRLRKIWEESQNRAINFSQKEDFEAIFEAILDYTDQSFSLSTDRQNILRVLLILLEPIEREVAFAYFFKDQKQSEIIANFAKKRIKLDIHFWNTLQQKLRKMIDAIKYITVLMQL